MARISFYMFKEQADGTTILDNDYDVNLLSAYRDGNLLPDADFVNNGDGTYYYEASGSGEYKVQLNDVTQYEYYQIYIPDEDKLTNLLVDNYSLYITGSGTGSLLTTIAPGGDELLFTASVVDSFLSASIDPLSANQGRILGEKRDGLLEYNEFILKHSNVVNSFTGSEYSSSEVQSAESLLLDLGDTTYIKDQTTYNGALRQLDIQINYVDFLVSQSQSTKHYLQYGDGASRTVYNQGMYQVGDVKDDEGYKMLRAGSLTGWSFVGNIQSNTTGYVSLGIRVNKPGSTTFGVIKTWTNPTSGSIQGSGDRKVSFDADEYILAELDIDLSVGSVNDMDVIFEITYDNVRQIASEGEFVLNKNLK